jgi:hypothetical protein
MPLLSPIIVNNVTLHTWHITETLDELLELAQHYNITLKPLKSILGAQQHIASQLIIHSVFGRITLNYIHNKPTLTQAHISITHTQNYAYLLVAPSVCGVDAEGISNKATRVKHKFCSVSERERWL